MGRSQVGSMLKSGRKPASKRRYKTFSYTACTADTRIRSVASFVFLIVFRSAQCVPPARLDLGRGKWQRGVGEENSPFFTSRHLQTNRDGQEGYRID